MGGKYGILRIPRSKALQRRNGMERLPKAGKQPPPDDLASGLSLGANGHAPQEEKRLSPNSRATHPSPAFECAPGAFSHRN